MSSVSHQARSATAATSENVTPFLSAKNLPEAISLTNTPGKVFSEDVSAAEDADGRSSAYLISPISPSRISSEAYTSSHRTGSRQRSSSSKVQAGVTPGVVHEIGIMTTVRYGKDFPVELDTPTAMLRIQKASEPLVVTPLSPPPAVPERPTLPSPPHASKEPPPDTVRASGVKSGTYAAQLAVLLLHPLRKDFAKPPSHLFSLRTPSTLPHESKTPPREQPPATHPRKPGAPKVSRSLDQRDMSSVARSNAHLSVLADLVDKKVFSEEDVLLELEAVRKRSLLTSAPFNKRLLPILAWYLLRDKFGDEAATRYVSLLTSPAGATRSDGAVSTASTIASFLPRVNEIRRVRREVKENNRKKPKHHYTISPPASPTEAARLSDIKGGHGERKHLRRTAAFDVLEDAPDIPTTGLLTPHSHNTLSSPCLHNRSPLMYDRLHVYTREHAVIDRRAAKAEDRPVVDVVLDAANRQDRAKNVFEVVEEQASSVVEEPSVFQGPGHKAPTTKGAASKSMSKERVPAPPASAHAACALGEAMARSRHGLPVHGSDASAMLDVTPSTGVFSDVSRANASEEGQSLFYRECVEGTGQERIPSVAAFWKAITSPDTSTARTAPDRRCLPPRHPQHGHVDRHGGPADLTGVVKPCVLNILALTDYGASAQPSGLAGETVDSSDLSTVADDTTSARSSVEYLQGLGGDHEWYDGEASAVPEENPASQTLTRTVAYSAMNDPHESRVGVGNTENTTGVAYCLATSFLLRDGSAAEATQTSKQQRTQRLHADLTSAENPMSHTVVATECYSTLPNASTTTHRPECSQRTRSVGSWEASSATMPSTTETFEEEGAVGRKTGYGSLIMSHIDTAAMSNAESIKTREDTGTGVHAVAEYSALAHLEALAMGPSDASGVHSPTIRTNGTLRLDTSAAAAAPFSVLEASSDMTDRARQSAQGVCDTAAVSKSRLLVSGVHSSRSGGRNTPFSDLPATGSPHDGTPTYSVFDTRTGTHLSPTSTTIKESSYAPSAPTGESAFGSLLRTNAETSAMGGEDHRQGFPIVSFHSTAISDASGYKHSALQGEKSADAGHCCVSRNTCWAHAVENSANGAPQFAAPPDDSASPPPAAAATGSRTASTNHRLSSGRATARRSLSDALAAHLGDASVMHNQRTGDDHSTQSVDARDTQSPSTITSATSPPSGSGIHHQIVQSRAGYGSMMGADSAVAPDTSVASRSNGGYSIGGGSEASVQSRAGYGSMMGADSAVAPDTSVASRSNGGYSIGGGSEASVQSRAGHGSMMGADSAVAPDTSVASRSNGGYSIGGGSEASVQSRAGYGSMMGADSAVGPDTSVASRSNGGYSIGGGSEASVQSRAGYGSMMGADSAVGPDMSVASRSNGGYSIGGGSEASVQSRAGYGSMMGADSAVGPDTSVASRSNGGYSIGGGSEASVQSRAGYGSMMGADSAVGPDMSVASRSNGGYSIGGGSEASVQSRAGYGSMMGADSAVGPDTSVASRSNGGYSFAGGECCSCVTESSARSASEKRSVKAGGSGASTMNCSHGQVGGGLSSCGVRECTPAAQESRSVERGASRVESSRSGDALSSHTPALRVPAVVCSECDSGVQPHSPTGSVVNPSRLTESTREETAASTCTAFLGCGREGATLSSVMDSDDLADALQRLGERHVSCLKDNSACTFGELGCQCATGRCKMWTTAATLPPPHQPQPVPPSDEEARAQRFDRFAMKSNSTESVPACESPNPPPPAAVPLEEESWNTAVPLQSRIPNAGVSSRSNATLVRVGAGFNLRTSPSPARGAEEASTWQATHQVSAVSELGAVTAAAAKSTTWGRCKDSDASRIGSFWEGDGLRSHVTILTYPRSSTELSVHNMPDAAIERADASIQQLREHQRSGSDFSGYRHADCLMMTPISILQSSPGSSRIHDPKRVRVATRPQAAATVPSGVSAGCDPTARGALTAGDSAATPFVVPIPLPPEATAASPTVCALGDEFLRMPQDMATVHLDGAKQSRRFSIMQPAHEAASDADDAEEVHEAEFTREVHAKHTNLTTLLSHSRLDASGTAETRSHVVDSSTVVTGKRLANADRSRSVGVLLGDQTAVDATAIDETRVDGIDESRETATPAGNDAEESWISVDSSTTQNTQLAMSVPGRRFAHRSPMHPYKCVRADHNSPEQRGQGQRRRTILDVPGVPYVDSPDISTHIDREARQKEKDRQLLAMRWAERGLMWQQQENEAQRYEEYQAHFCAGKERPRGPRVMIMKPGQQGAVALQGPRPPNVPRPPMPMHPRSPGYPPRRRHS
ncbi:hypothetical protein, unknown function [Leishmania mexicana MHOM/GT/2001/U1103]|uniref:Uncharacterized protein n=1 Tax=Leishmania mexicana (strain MHOM/GT/2001/U1103) TaxID=929439 RepID=E9B223_LEIMU|nr:hypothetical protein, unknown function [Leishmania mexicana MHOM/GT/2001/U1103]CBZ29280.1 hypothetical protein, unknown function [Leishmania mexicana MHOM/GT/2001/U1103]